MLTIERTLFKFMLNPLLFLNKYSENINYKMYVGDYFSFNLTNL